MLRGSITLRSAGVAYDDRVAQAVDLVASKCDSDEAWPLEVQYPGVRRSRRTKARCSQADGT